MSAIQPTCFTCEKIIPPDVKLNRKCSIAFCSHTCHNLFMQTVMAENSDIPRSSPIDIPVNEVSLSFDQLRLGRDKPNVAKVLFPETKTENKEKK